IGSWLAKTSTHNHAVAVAGQPVTDGAENLVTLLPALKNLLCDRKRKHCRVCFAADAIGLRASARSCGHSRIALRRASLRRSVFCRLPVLASALLIRNAHLARVKQRIVPEIAARHCPFDQRAR